MINKVAVHRFVWLGYAMMWGLHVDYITSAAGHTCLVWQVHMVRAYANNVKCIHTSACGSNANCSEFIYKLYILNIVVWYLYNELICIYGTYIYILHFGGHMCCWHLYGKNMVKKSCKLFYFFTNMYTNVGSICRLQEQCSGIYMYSVACIFIQWHMPIM